MKWYILALKKYATFTGRSQRKEYWMFVLFYLIFYIAAIILDSVTGLTSSPGKSGIITSLFSLAMLVPSLAVTVRRFHDIGKSGWWVVAFMIAYIIIGAAVFISILSAVLGMGLSADDIDTATAMQAVKPMLWAFLLMFVVGIVQLYFLVKDSQPGANKWGPNPKEPEVTDFTSFQ